MKVGSKEFFDIADRVINDFTRKHPSNTWFERKNDMRGHIYMRAAEHGDFAHAPQAIAWMRMVALNWWKDQHRWGKWAPMATLSKRCTEEEMVENLAIKATIYRHITEEEMADRLWLDECFNQLKEADQEVIKQRVRCDTDQELADNMEVHLNVIKTRLYRARHRVRRLYNAS